MGLREGHYATGLWQVTNGAEIRSITVLRPPRSRGQWLDRRGVASDPRAPMHGCRRCVHRGFLLMYCLSLDTTIKTSCALPAVRHPPRESGSVCGAAGVLSAHPHGSGGLCLCPRLTMAHHRTWASSTRPSKAKAMTRAIARPTHYRIIGCWNSMVFACTCRNAICIGAAHIAAPLKAVLDVRVQLRHLATCHMASVH